MNNENIFYTIPIIQKVGIYAIHNKISNKYYVGSSVNIYKRMIDHARAIERNISNIKICSDIKKYGYDSFEFLIMETFPDFTITDEELRKKEKYYINKFDCIKSGYNRNGTYPSGRVKQNVLLECKLIKPRKIDLKAEIKNTNNITIVLPLEVIKVLDSKDIADINKYIFTLIKKDISA